MATLTPAEAPFTRKRVGAHYVWSRELDLALAFAAENGLRLYLTDAPYQVAKLIGDGVKLVIYPHTTKSTRNQHLRVRDEGSADKGRAQETMARLSAAAGFNCTFKPKWSTNVVAHRRSMDSDILAATSKATGL